MKSPLDPAWSDKYLGKHWSIEKNCFYWTSRIINEQTAWSLPVVSNQTSKLRRARILLKEEKENWQEVTNHQELYHFDIILMRHFGGQQNEHHLGVWTEANGGSIVHACEWSCIDLDTPIELAARCYEIKRVLRHV